MVNKKNATYARKRPCMQYLIPTKATIRLQVHRDSPLELLILQIVFLEGHKPTKIFPFKCNVGSWA